MIAPLTIIAATNYSQTAANAVQYAAGLARAAGAELVLFHSFALGVHSANSLITADEMQKQLNKAAVKLDVLGRETAERFKISVRSFCSYSFVEEQLSSLIDAEKADLVVMGMAERSFEQELLGNTTTTVIKKIKIPVLAVPVNARFENIKKVMYACDTLSFSIVKKFGWIRRIIGDMGIEIELFNVDQTIAELKGRKDAAVSDSEIKMEFEDEKYIYKTVRSNAVIKEIEKEIRYYKADILVMAERRYGFWDSLVHRSKTRIMAAGLDIPLISFPGY